MDSTLPKFDNATSHTVPSRHLFEKIPLAKEHGESLLTKQLRAAPPSHGTLSSRSVSSSEVGHELFSPYQIRALRRLVERFSATS
ncbi:hypothetical protein BCR33DRAFT_716265 [Rhizoclosmatium globosum]|uniref:Uncharacterized protein n=1 Tax=Rhizoclosmatium globosum TaxID=329046 RepID=A0A1Y2CEX9_9FUNG|nr:hypothetical protein BCR33DRAFT_716265 [Rhizoclosmatium globosum]|eukprot:ORY45613.1 hypothetical protein BCR33DRAFT_716265 [Rhizoclosmatium globosum]